MGIEVQEQLYKILAESEIKVDKAIKELSIWKYPFQTILCSALFNAEKISFDNDGDSAVDYLGRVAEVYKSMREHAADGFDMTTTEALLKGVDDPEFFEDLNRLYLYGHFSMIMPQIHRNVFMVTRVTENSFKLTFKSKELEQAEVKDRILGVLPEQFSMEFPRKAFLEKYLEQRLASGQIELCQADQPWIDELYRHHMVTQQRIELLADDILLEHLGFSNGDYNQFTAAIKAFSDFSIYLGHAFKLSAESTTGEETELFMGEYMENVVCTLNYAFFDNTRQLSGLHDDKFKALLGYFAQHYQQPETYQVKSYSSCGDGYLPPFELGKKVVVFSPHSIRHLHTFNNILYSINKTRQALFNNHLSSALEPVLINQTEKLFAVFPDLKIRKNINYPGSEIDMMVLSEAEKVCLIFQAKATLAPASTRTLSRVQTRSLEGIDQIKKFEDLPLENKLRIINGSFGTNHPDLKIISILLVRSSAGSEEVWGTGIPIVNHSFLAGMLYRKLSKNDIRFAEFDKQIDQYMKELISISGWKINEEKFEISDLTIRFPDIDLKFIDLIAFNFKHAARYGDAYFKAK